MKNLKLLNKNYLSVILFYLFIGLTAQSEEPVDIWNIEEKKTNENISVTENTKMLMERILKTRKTVKQYVIYNITFMYLGIILGVIMELSSNSETQILISDIKSEGENGIYIFYLIVAVLSLIAMALITILFLGFYYLIYGLLLKRLKINYKELKKIVDVE